MRPADSGMSLSVNRIPGDGQSLSPFESRTTTEVAVALILVIVSGFLVIWCAFWP